MPQKNYLTRQQDLLKKVRRDFHRPTKVLDKNQFTKIISHISNLESVNAKI